MILIEIIINILGEIPYRSFDTSSIALRGHKNSYITVHLDKNIDCSSEELTPSTVFHVVQIKPDTVALQSSIGGFLSGGFINFHLSLLPLTELYINQAAVSTVYN